MPSVWIRKRTTRGGALRHLVEFRIGGSGEPVKHGGSFPTIREARLRRDWITGELAAMRFPDVRALARAAEVVTVNDAADRWLVSRRDVREGTRKTYDVSLGRLRPRIGTLAVAELTPARINALVEELVADGLGRDSIRKSLSHLAMMLDHEEIEPNPIRSPLVKLPRKERKKVTVPTADHVIAIHAAILEKYRLPLVVLEATGMRVGELELLGWDDVDAPRRRWRCGHKTDGSLRWVEPPPEVFAAVLALKPTAGNVVELDPGEASRVFEGLDQAAMRRAMTRACQKAGVPHYHPHDLRHRIISRLHAEGVSWARIGEAVGHDDIFTTARTYTHVIADEAKIDYAALVA